VQLTAQRALHPAFGADGTMALEEPSLQTLGGGTFGAHALLLDGDVAYVTGTRTAGSGPTATSTGYLLRVALPAGSRSSAERLRERERTRGPRQADRRLEPSRPYPLTRSFTRPSSLSASDAGGCG